MNGPELRAIIQSRIGLFCLRMIDLNHFQILKNSGCRKLRGNSEGFCYA